MTVLSLSVSVCIEVINQKLRQHQYHCYAVLPYNLLAVFWDKYLNSCNRQKWWYYYKMGDEFNRAKYTNQIWNCISSILYHYRQTSLTKKIKQCIQYNRRVASFTYSKMNYLNSKTSWSFLLNALTDLMLAKIIRNDAEAWLDDAGYSVNEKSRSISMPRKTDSTMDLLDDFLHGQEWPMYLTTVFSKAVI